jgi:tetratricopeptide (TPR) repeat protein
MKNSRTLCLLAAGITAASFAACSNLKITHVRPGQSARAALAANAEAAPAPDEMPAPATDAVPSATAAAPQPPQISPVPALPAHPAPGATSTAESVADAYTRGTFAMQAGQTPEAIAAFEEAVKLDPDFTDAWGKLAMLYQKEGKTAKATEAFKKAKRLGDANGGTVTRDATGGLQLP